MWWLVSLLLFCGCGGVQVWETLLDQSQLLARLAYQAPTTGTSTNKIVVNVNSQTYQEIYGFGGALTESSAYNFIQMKKANQTNYNAVLKALFDPISGAGFTMMRIPMGSCDMGFTPYYTYDQVSQDQLFKNWTWSREEQYMLPVLKDILKINSKIQIIIAPWSAPTWMKTSSSASNAFFWGTLQTSMYDDFAYYFQVTIQKYQAEGINVAALALQNEPQNEPNSYPVMRLSAQNESALAKILGPKLNKSSITTKILVFDHNWDNYQYPIDVLSDSDAYQYIAGSAFHCYGGNVSTQNYVHQAYPDKEIWFTECSGTGPSSFNGNIQWNTNNLYFGAIKNWARTVLHWNYAVDSNYGPSSGGCSDCRGIITVQPDNVTVTYNEEYYGMAMISKFLVYPAYRLNCTLAGAKTCVDTLCFKNGDGTTLIVLANFCSTSQVTAVQKGGSFIQVTANVGLTSFIWESSAAVSTTSSTIGGTTSASKTTTSSSSSSVAHTTSAASTATTTASKSTSTTTPATTTSTSSKGTTTTSTTTPTPTPTSQPTTQAPAVLASSTSATPTTPQTASNSAESIYASSVMLLFIIVHLL